MPLSTLLHVDDADLFILNNNLDKVFEVVKKVQSYYAHNMNYLDESLIQHCKTKSHVKHHGNDE